ncbi:MAG: choice-of-anchor D domain-containing protein [Ignavibacteriales bacterium]|nr:choice-of-anchor D domain-containing protein [Ignavibacteriales bacterium]
MALQYYDANYYKSYYASSGDGSAKAIYKPTIKISGKYKVYEWHGWRGKYASSYKEASNVPCTIVHSNGITSLTIDQLNNSGKWNMLGTFTFNAGDSASIAISNQADGFVISDAFKFEYVNEDGSAPSVPELSSPSNGAFNIVNPPTMSWNAVTGANKYQLQITTDSLFSNIVFTDSLITTLSKQITALTFNTTYFWKLRAENQFGVSNWSNVWHFTTVTSALSIPVLSFPDNGSINVNTPLNLIWDSVSSAVKYYLQIASDSGFTQKVVDDTSITTTSKQVNSLNYKKQYYWRVKAKNNVTSSEFSHAWQFTTQDVSTSLTMNSSYIDFGKVLIGTTKMDSITLSNNGVDTMVISGIQVSSPQFLVNCSSLVIAPGAQEKMFIVFMATKKATFTANITFGYGPPLDFDTIRVSGRGIAPPRNLRNLAKITFVGVPLGTSAVDSFFIHNDGETDLVIDSMRTTSSTFEVNPVALTVAPNDSELVYVSASPKFYQSESAYIIFIDNSVKSPDSMVVELSELTDVREEAIPTEYSIKQNYPNPFNPTTTIRYSLPFSSNVTIKVFNIIGQEVITLIDGIESSGYKAAIWNGNDQNGNQVPSGTYLYRIEAKSTIDQNSIYTAVKKMILMK